MRGCNYCGLFQNVQFHVERKISQPCMQWKAWRTGIRTKLNVGTVSYAFAESDEDATHQRSLTVAFTLRFSPNIQITQKPPLRRNDNDWAQTDKQAAHFHLAIVTRLSYI